MNNPKGVVTLLGSGNSLGAYVPAVQLSRRLDAQGIRSEICVLENFYRDSIKNKVPAYRKAFHNDFNLAKKSAEFAHDISGSFDPLKVEQLLDEWEREGRNSFIATTGFWLPVLNQYRERHGSGGLKVDLLHLDAGISVSYVVYRELIGDFYRKIRFFDTSCSQMAMTLSITEQSAIPLAEREQRFTLHGGGWGIGTYKRACREMLAGGMQLNVLAYFDNDIEMSENVRYYMNDPNWSPWLKDGRGVHGFPPLGRIDSGYPVVYSRRDDYPPLFDIIRNSMAIISKPGGYSLFESLESATPFIFLEPFAKHEESNARYWIERGLGIWYDDWKTQGYAFEPLVRIHENLLQARASTIEYGGNLYAAENESNV
ncbi:hypothetical protein BBD42_24945 [Paenibacillus sp. BIHB 4019]|uniref:UDP-glucuronosyltransferase n=1 Tax=Paenibacillus sp. BIHB 4019 TaxID=1870819 RepID=A0A1B2DNT5_9BACL|nr:hypothetical protein [Paenibacillus sp. BIHB 4019]ANY69368.1 hypothetical protein BBD42_24945 [Paenibacillus sp. BIHB 4019]